MIGVASVARVAALMGDPARTNILYALKDDGTVSAGDLTAVAGVAPSTASEHLAKLTEAGLVTMRADGRKRYYRLADPAVADVLDSVEGLAALLQKQAAEQPAWDSEAVHVRACLDHLAGRLGGRVAGTLIDRGLVRHSSKGVDLTDDGAVWLGSLGADVATLRAEPRKLIGLCPDWTGDLPHLGGSVGAAMLNGFVSNGWLRRLPGKHRVAITPTGVTAFRDRLGLDVRETAP
jgi:DNA-binding transcriptional ArsR family regulator